MFIDEAEVILKGGHGGPGRVSFRPGKYGGPDGGDGGKGGSVYIKATTDLLALRPYTTVKTLSAENGKGGEGNLKTGLNGKDLVVEMPVGTVIEDLETGETLEVNSPEDIILACEGGLGGRGNASFASSRNTTPRFAQSGLEGQKRHVKLHLKLIADFGLIGLPNAGKSSLLNELTKATAKVADYPFTTLEPNLGVLYSKVLADIPGLIEGASGGKGLGVKFLKHIEKTTILLHCISSESEDFKKDYLVIRKELGEYNKSLLEKPEIILITKSDLIDKSALDKKIKKFRSQLTSSPINQLTAISIHDWDSLENLKKLLLT